MAARELPAQTTVQRYTMDVTLKMLAGEAVTRLERNNPGAVYTVHWRRGRRGGHGEAPLVEAEGGTVIWGSSERLCFSTKALQDVDGRPQRREKEPKLMSLWVEQRTARGRRSSVGDPFQVDLSKYLTSPYPKEFSFPIPIPAGRAEELGRARLHILFSAVCEDTRVLHYPEEDSSDDGDETDYYDTELPTDYTSGGESLHQSGADERRPWLPPQAPPQQPAARQQQPPQQSEYGRRSPCGSRSSGEPRGSPPRQHGSQYAAAAEEAPPPLPVPQQRPRLQSPPPPPKLQQQQEWGAAPPDAPEPNVTMDPQTAAEQLASFPPPPPSVIGRLRRRGTQEGAGSGCDGGSAAYGDGSFAGRRGSGASRGTDGDGQPQPQPPQQQLPRPASAVSGGAWTAASYNSQDGAAGALHGGGVPRRIGGARSAPPAYAMAAEDLASGGVDGEGVSELLSSNLALRQENESLRRRLGASRADSAGGRADAASAAEWRRQNRELKEREIELTVRHEAELRQAREALAEREAALDDAERLIEQLRQRCERSEALYRQKERQLTDFKLGRSGAAMHGSSAMRRERGARGSVAGVSETAAGPAEKRPCDVQCSVQ